MSARPVFRWLLLAALALTLPALEGCGRKPKLLDPPEGSGPAAATFPHDYPNSKYDPRPPGQPASPAAQPGPLEPGNAYPTIIRPDEIGNSTSLSMPSPEAAWATPSTRNQP